MDALNTFYGARPERGLHKNKMRQFEELVLYDFEDDFEFITLQGNEFEITYLSTRSRKQTGANRLSYD